MAKAFLKNNKPVLRNGKPFWNAQGDECCCGPPPQCWAKYTVCPCSAKVPGIPTFAYKTCAGGGVPPPFVVGNAFLPGTNETAGPACWQLVSIDAELPPDSWIITSGFEIEGCDECCGCPDTSYCMDTCSDVFVVIVPAHTVNHGGCLIDVPQVTFPVCCGTNCSWTGCSNLYSAFFQCIQTGLTEATTAQIGCGTIDGTPYWLLGVGEICTGDCTICGPNASYRKPAGEFSCPAGSYVKYAGSPSMPGSITVS